MYCLTVFIEFHWGKFHFLQEVMHRKRYTYIDTFCLVVNHHALYLVIKLGVYSIPDIQKSIDILFLKSDLFENCARIV
jgi:hypothetical protein